MPESLIFADYPLALGATWIYSATIDYQKPNTFDQVISWRGLITDTIIDEYTTFGGNIVFTLQEDMNPPIELQGVHRQPATYAYVVSGDGIYKDGIKIYQWPLSDHVSWEAIPGLGYEMEVNFIGNIDTLYGELKGCYQFFLVTNPDSTVDTFCPGIGFVDHYYQHHGTVQIENFVLVDYRPGK